MTSNARFWVFINDGFVKLTLKPQQSLRHSAGGLDDEGWWREDDDWYHDGEGVERTSVSDSADCDGRLTRVSECYCPLNQLRVRVIARYAPLLPDWQLVDRMQRDYSAEAMGY